MQQETQGSQALDLGYNPESVSRVFNWRWYKHQLTGWSKTSYILLLIGIIIQGAIGMMDGVTPMSITTTLASWLGWITVLAIVENRAINGLTAIIQVILLVYVALVTTNYSDIFMQIVYLVLLDIPILFSSRWKSDDKKTKGITLKSSGVSLLWLAFFWVALYVVDTTLLPAQRPLVDSLAAAIGVVGAIYTVKKEDLSFVYWMGQSVASTTLWLITALSTPHPVWVLAFTYGMYAVNDIFALFGPGNPWFAGMKKKIYGDKFKFESLEK